MTNFSKRNNLLQDLLQVKSLNKFTRNSIWNLMYIYFFKTEWNRYVVFAYKEKYKDLYTLIWVRFFGNKVNKMPSDADFSEIIEKFIDDAEWNRIYDFIEFILIYLDDHYKSVKQQFIEYLNNILKSENTCYQIVNNYIVELVSSEEIEEVNSVLSLEQKYEPIKKHFNEALKLLSNKVNPDYRNSIKESISGVEALCRIITNDNKATLGEALKIIEKDKKIHKSLIKAFLAIYGYTSDGDAIRHSFTDESEIINKEDAIYFLVTCSAFINFLITKFEKD